MKCVRVHRRTALVGVTMYDLGIMADSLASDLGMTEPPSPPTPIDFRPDIERLFRQVTSMIAAMADYAEEHPEADSRDLGRP
jgi:hypothetical protein